MEAFFSKLTEAANNQATPSAKLGIRSLKFDTFHFGNAVATRRSAVLWWFYSLFSQDARHSIHRLELTQFVESVPTVVDMRWLAEMLRTRGAPHSELFIADVFEEYAASDGPAYDRWVVVPSGYTIHTQLGDDSPEHTLLFTDHVTRLRVLRDEPSLQFVDILVPGYGRCWVRRSETVVVDTPPLTHWTFDQHTIKTMDLGLPNVDEADLSRLREFLQLVGRPVETLRLTQPMLTLAVNPGRLEADFLAGLLEICPRLEKLSLERVPLASAASLVGLYEHHACGIKSLDLSAGAFVDQASVLSFLQALRDPTMKISRTVEKMSLDITDYDADGRENDATLLLAVIAMLESNKSLQSVHIHVSQVLLTSYESQFRSLRETVIHFQKAPLALRAKCALLGAVSQTIMPLEQGILASVLGFAAECETRKLTISTPSD